MRRATLPLPAGDAKLILSKLRPLLRPYEETVTAYQWPTVDVRPTVAAHQHSAANRTN